MSNDIDYICSTCGGFDFIYSRPRWCPFCAVRVDAPLFETQGRGVKRKRVVVNEGKENKRYIEFNETKRKLDKKIIANNDLSVEEYDALIKSWVNIQ